MAEAKEEVKETVSKVLPNPYQKLLDKLFPDGEFTQEELDEKVDNLIEMKLEYQSYIDMPPKPKESLFKQACSNDDLTIKSWEKVWIDNTRENAKNYNILSNSVMKVHGKNALQPGIIAGSGPSLKKNVKELAKNRGDICLTSCAHNFAYFVDNNVKADYYVNLDAGDITIPELSQGGKKPEQYYWDATKDHTLVVATVCKPEFINRWKGEVLWYNTQIPDVKIMKTMKEIVDFKCYFNTGGNALGACLYMAKSILGSNPIAFIGADFSFGYTKKFHPFDSPYDSKFAGVIPCTDVFGNRVYTWPSYNNFAQWFIYQTMGGKGNNPGMWYNCTEGGILGSYPEGNVRTIEQMSLKKFLYCYNMHKLMPDLLLQENPQLLF